MTNKKQTVDLNKDYIKMENDMSDMYEVYITLHETQSNKYNIYMKRFNNEQDANNEYDRLDLDYLFEIGLLTETDKYVIIETSERHRKYIPKDRFYNMSISFNNYLYKPVKKLNF